jgi:hypothetical protein
VFQIGVPTSTNFLGFLFHFYVFFPRRRLILKIFLIWKTCHMGPTCRHRSLRAWAHLSMPSSHLAVIMRGAMRAPASQQRRSERRLSEPTAVSSPPPRLSERRPQPEAAVFPLPGSAAPASPDKSHRIACSRLSWPPRSPPLLPPRRPSSLSSQAEREPKPPSYCLDCR